MAKLHIPTILNQIQEETPSRAEMHPYYGLRDNRGWLTRYPTSDELDNEYHNELISAKWVREYIQECKELQIQPNFDVMGCYGPSPYFRWLENHSSKLIAKLVSLQYENRFDYIPHLGQMAEYGIEINPEITLEDLKILLSGYEKFRVLGFWRHPIMTLGRKSWYWVGQELAKHHIQNLSVWNHEVRWRLKSILPEAESDEYFKAHELGYKEVFESRPDLVESLYTKPNRREYIQSETKFREIDRNSWDKSSNCRDYSARYLQLLAKYRSKEDVMRVYRKSKDADYTHVAYGTLLYSSDTQVPFLFLDYSGELHILKVRKYAGLNAVALPKGYLVYKDYVPEHVEATKLRDAVSRFKGRYRVKGNTMSLRDVVNARHFCFRGTLRFLQNRMPHVARLIQPYEAWNQVPAEIMDIQWELASRDIFKGYVAP